MPRKGLPFCDCIEVRGRPACRRWWLVKENPSGAYIMCKNCGEVKKTRTKRLYRRQMELMPVNWKELLGGKR